MWIDLRPQCPKFSLRREPGHFLLASLPIVALARHANRVDAARDDGRDGVEKREIVRE